MQYHKYTLHILCMRYEYVMEHVGLSARSLSPVTVAIYNDEFDNNCRQCSECVRAGSESQDSNGDAVQG
jgi:hypothetical protein